MTREVSRPQRCDHKFVDSNVCLKCGWAPPSAAPLDLEAIPCEDCEGRGWAEIETGGPAGTMTNTCSRCGGEGVL
jgi:DnaJ-class molecular chaperone